jgi:hypothetical protein
MTNLTAFDFVLVNPATGVEMPTYKLVSILFSGELNTIIQEIKSAKSWMASSKTFRNYWRAKKLYFGRNSKIVDLAKLGGSKAICSSETFAIGGGECSVEYYDYEAKILFEIVGENGTRAEAFDFNQELERIRSGEGASSEGGTFNFQQELEAIRGGGQGGGSPNGAVGQPGSSNTGGGGGGGAGGFTVNGGNGGSGRVVIRVPTSAYSGTTTGSPTVTTDGSYTVVKFTSSGTYTA